MTNNIIHFIFKNNYQGNDDLISLEYKNNSFYLFCTCCNNNCWHVEELLKKIYNNYCNIQTNNYYGEIFPVDNNIIINIPHLDKYTNKTYKISIIFSNNEFYFRCNCYDHLSENYSYRCKHLNEIFSKFKEHKQMNELNFELNNMSL